MESSDVLPAERTRTPTSPTRSVAAIGGVPPSFLIDALLAGDVSRAQGAVLAGADVNGGTDERGYTALHLAVMRGIVGVTRMLVANRADINSAGNRQRLTPLHLATADGRTALAKMLIQAHADPTLVSADGVPALALDETPDGSFGRSSPTGLASPKGLRPTSSRRRARNCAQCDSLPDEPLRGLPGNILVDAIARGDVAVAQGMILARVDPNSARDCHGHTALQLAATKGTCGVIRLLVNHAAELEATSHGQEHTALHIGALHGHCIVVKLLVELKAAVNARNPAGDTPLSLSMPNNNLDLVRVLLDGKALPQQRRLIEVDDAETDLNESSISDAGGVALFAGLSTDTTLFPSSILDPSVRANPPSALLEAAKNNADKEIILELLQAGARVPTQDADVNAPPLITAALNGNVRVARCLLNGHADPNIHTQDLHTPMHFAARNGDTRMIRLLTQSRADINMKDHNGMLPVQYSMNNSTTQQLFKLGSRSVQGHTTAKLNITLPPNTLRLESPSPGSPASPASPGSPPLTAGSGTGPWSRRGQRSVNAFKTHDLASETGLLRNALAIQADGRRLPSTAAAGPTSPVGLSGSPKALFSSNSCPILSPALSPISVAARSMAAT